MAIAFGDASRACGPPPERGAQPTPGRQLMAIAFGDASRACGPPPERGAQPTPGRQRVYGEVYEAGGGFGTLLKSPPTDRSAFSASSSVLTLTTFRCLPAWATASLYS